MSSSGRGRARLVASLIALLAAGALVIWSFLDEQGGQAAAPLAARNAAPVEPARLGAQNEPDLATGASGSAPDARTVVPAAFADGSQEGLRAGRAEDAIVGVVRNAEGAPVADAQVRIECSNGRSYGLLVLSFSRAQEILGDTKTDAAGRFRLPARTGRAHRLSASARGLATARVQDVPAGSYVELVLPSAASLTGSVRFADGTPLTNGALRGWDQASRVELFRGTTDGQGNFRFDDLPACAARVDVESASGAVPWYDVVLLAGETTHLDVEVPLGVRVFGRVTAAESGEPIAGARVGLGWVMERPVESDPDGWYELLHYAGVGHFELAVEARGFGRAEASLVVPEGEDLRRDFQLFAGLSADGRVVDPEGAPLPGVVVLAQGEGADALDLAEARSDLAGTFRFDSLRPDLTHVLVFLHPAHAERVVDLVGAPPDGRAFHLGDVALSVPAALAGRVVDADGAPWPGLKVTITDRSEATLAAFQRAGVSGYSLARFARRVWSDDTGAFLATGLGAGSHTLSVQAPGSSSQATLEVALTAGVRTDGLELVLPRGAAVRGVVVDASGTAVAGARVRLFEAGANWSHVSTSTALDGTFTLRPATDGPGGLVGLQVEQEDWALAPGTPRLATVFVGGIDPSEDTLQRITLPRAVPLSGLVLEPDGAPAAHARVQLERSPELPFEWNAVTSTDVEGRFTLWVAPHRVTTLVAEGTRRSEDQLSGYPVDDERPRRATAPPLDAGPTGRDGLLLQLLSVEREADGR